MLQLKHCFLVYALAWWISVDANYLSKAWNRALKQTMFEQEVEDENSVHRIDNHLVRRLIVMPLTEAFNPNQATAMHGKVQYGDKCSLPASIGRVIFEKPYDVPWLFEISPVNKHKSLLGRKVGVTIHVNNNETSAEIRQEEANAKQKVEEEEGEDDEDDGTESKKMQPLVRVLDKAYISPLDFRSPENYIFLPQWLMKTLGVKTNDLVDVSFVRIKLAGLVVFQPLTLEWDALMEANQDPKTVLEHEVNKYSSLTTGSTIYIEFKGVEYPLYVKETRAEGGVAVRGVRVQDSDVKVDIDRSIIDAIIKEKKGKEQLELEKLEEAKEKGRGGGRKLGGGLDKD